MFSTKRSKWLAVVSLVILLVIVVIVVAASRPQTQSLKRFDIKISKNEISSGPKVIEIRKGTPVHIQITASEQDESDFTINGYGHSTSIEQGSEANLEFTADHAGTFDMVLVTEEEHEHEEGHAEGAEEEAEEYGPPKVIGTLRVK
jgi:hypothetical protein